MILLLWMPNVFVGAGIKEQTQVLGVNLTVPDVTIFIEIRHKSYFLIQESFRGMGGFPLGTQRPVLSLISGGFDSAVSSYFMIKRGINTHFCLFNLGGEAHEIAVKELAFFLWKKYGVSHYVRFVSVPFQEVVEHILLHVTPSYAGVILKRMMMQVATKIAQEMELSALVTGESIAQVSSQTLPNLSVVDQASALLTLRPLITMNKQDIIKQAKHIGTDVFTNKIPEYCSVISKNPTTRANLGACYARRKKIRSKHHSARDTSA